MFPEALLLVATGLVAGAAHCLMGPDHLAAVLPLAARSPRAAVRIGVAWGVGHGSGVLILAGLFQLLKGTFDLEVASGYAELAVGVFLVGLGLWTLRTTRAVVVHSHAHDHHDHAHAHPHLHIGDRTAGRPEHPEVGAHRRHQHSALFFGGLHGLAGTSHLLGIFPSLMLEGGQAMIYLAAFLFGSMGAMAGVGLLAGRVVAHNPRHLNTSIRVAGAFSLAVGCVWIWQSAA